MRADKLLWVLAGTLFLSVVAYGQGAVGGGSSSTAASVPRTPDGKPDLTGRWNGEAGQITHTNILEEHGGGFGIRAGKSLIIDPPDGIIPYQPWALAERNRRRLDSSAYMDQVGHCEFRGIARVHTGAQEFMYAGNSIIHTAGNMTRVIDMDRREHLPESIRLWLGDPIGRWEGDRLVVDSTNFNGRTQMAIGGDFYSADAHIVERYTLVDANTMNWTMTFNDPKVFTRPWTMTTGVPMARQRVPVDDFNGEDDCHEGNTDLLHLKNVYDQARKANPQLK